jgi:hypothetical protein
MKVEIKLHKKRNDFLLLELKEKGNFQIVVHAKKRGIFTASNRDETRPQTHSSPH